MKRTYSKNRPTRELIMQKGMQLFLEKGYTATHCSHISKALGISPGNLTFYFPTKEHLLAELTSQLCAFQWKVMEEANNDGKSPLFSYCMEIATMSAMCDQSAIAKDFFISAYTHPMSLQVIRRNDVVKAKQIFATFKPDFTDEDFACAENIVSGIELAALMADDIENVTLEKRIRFALDSVLKLYDVPQQLREEKLRKIQNFDYRTTANTLLREFSTYVDEVNAQAVQQYIDFTNRHSHYER